MKEWEEPVAPEKAPVWEKLNASFFPVFFFTFLSSLRKCSEVAEKNTRKELPETKLAIEMEGLENNWKKILSTQNQSTPCIFLLNIWAISHPGLKTQKIRHWGPCVKIGRHFWTIKKWLSGRWMPCIPSQTFLIYLRDALQSSCWWVLHWKMLHSLRLRWQWHLWVLCCVSLSAGSRPSAEMHINALTCFTPGQVERGKNEFAQAKHPCAFCL